MRDIRTGVRSRVWGACVLGWMAMRSASSVSQLTALRKKLPFPE